LTPNCGSCETEVSTKPNRKMNQQTQRTAHEHFTLLYTLVHALAQSGAQVVELRSQQPVDPRESCTPPDEGPGIQYSLQLAPWDADLIIQVYILQALLVADAQVRVSWNDGTQQREEVIVKIGWSDLGQLTSVPISVMPADFRGTIPLYPASCVFYVRI
jgi:hypothetical protein